VRPPAFDTEAYKRRNTVERTFNKLKAFRAVAMRTDKREFVFQGTIDVASIKIWLRDPVTQDPPDAPYAARLLTLAGYFAPGGNRSAWCGVGATQATTEGTHMGDRRWGFEDLDDWEYEEVRDRQAASQPADPAETVSGQDADHVVTVQVTPTGEVTSVRLAAGWKQAVDPRALGTSVLAAANAATVAAMVTQLDLVEPPPSAPAPHHADPTPLTRQDVDRLLDAVTADLQDFTQRVAEVVDRPVSAESVGRHVSGTAVRGRVLQVSVDPGWASRSRTSEIEGELVDVLGQLSRRSTPGELVQGPRSSAIAELHALASDPTTLLDRLRLGRNQQTTGGSNGR